jgi:hypothetical protein
MVDSVKGAFDCVITRGMEVVYPGRQSSSIWMNRGTVVDLGSGTDYYDRPYSWIKVQKTGSTSSWQNKSARVVTITSVSKVVPFHRS